jgi:tetratricopeptide (TPR) repeat protein
VRVSPDFAFGQSMLSEWYLVHGMVEPALAASEKSMQLSPGHDGITTTRALVLEAAGELESAWQLVQQLIDRGNNTPCLARIYGRMARRRGQQDRALGLIESLLQSPGVTPVDRSDLYFSAADLLDGLGRFDDAFTYAARGNALRKPNYRPEAHDQWFDTLISYFTRHRVRALARANYHSEKPVFIVGMPRSGTSLVEQMLASNPRVHGAGELDFLFRVVVGTIGMLGAGENDYPQCLGKLSVEQCDGMAQIYVEPLNSLCPTAHRITDKMPLNFLHLGIVNMLLPGARIIHCKRDPLDTCLSCHMTAFTTGNDFKYDLNHLGRFYRQYARLMKHWQQVLDVPILEVNYEQVIADPEGQSRRMTDFIGLPWDDRAVRFHETKRSIATASVQQVRQPIYHTSVQRWRHYEKHLGPLKAALGDF